MDIEKIGVYEFRELERNSIKEEINKPLLLSLLKNSGLTHKEFGLCDEPYEKTFEIGHEDEHGSACSSGTPNIILVELCESYTYKKKVYYSTMDISKINNKYHICCLAQTSHYKSYSGAEHTVYVCGESELEESLTEAFKFVNNTIK